MKKLMIALASAATAVFAFGEDVLPHGADFENANYTAGENFTNYVNKADDGVATSGNRYWYSTSEDIGIISNHQEISVTSVPDLYENATPTGGVKYLQLDTQTPLFRTIANNDQSGSFTGVDISTGDGIYLDTLVKFTASEDEFKDGALADGDKIAIEYVDQTTDETIENQIKAFVIRAGYIGSNSLSQTNYYAYLPDDKTFQNFDINAWHRLTVRTIANIGGNNVGFIVYLDQKPLAYDGVCGDDFSPSTDAQNYYNNEIHAVYPSAIEASDIGGDQIAAVAFSGNGSIDDVVFTTEKPAFITASESVIVPFVADAGVTAISVEVDDDVVTNIAVTAAGTYAATLEAQTTAFTVNVTVDEANGYTLGSISYNGTPLVTQV